MNLYEVSTNPRQAPVVLLCYDSIDNHHVVLVHVLNPCALLADSLTLGQIPHDRLVCDHLLL